MTLLDDRSTTTSDEDRAARRRPAAGERRTRSGAAEQTGERRVRRGTGSLAAGRRKAAAEAESLFARLRAMPLVLPLVALVVGALAITLYLSTKSAQDAYALAAAKAENQSLSDKRDELKKTYDSGNSAPELSDKAGKLGMVPVAGAPQMVVGADGKARLQGTLDPVTGRRMDSLNPAPDPVSQIDGTKVDDSTGLNGGSELGDGRRSSGTETSGTESSPGTEASGTESTGDRTSGRAPAGEQPGESGESAEPDAPAPNVLPSSAATPGRNAPQER
ncbi:hypothetical protein [Gordonia sp. VNK21]|uniref:hypothetical protein n=1 Tax=Gordonia sp. VNK21 TaxID=3382483 RepID=UPI0038D4E06B